MNTGDTCVINAEDETKSRVVERLTVGKQYTYAQMCEAFGEEKTEGGWQRRLQKERWARFIKWENPTKRTYAIVDIFDSPIPKPEDGRKNNGGKRDGAGAKIKCAGEYSVLLGSFLGLWESRSSYNGLPMESIYFTSTEVGKYFGFMTDGVLNIEEGIEEWIARKCLSSGFRVKPEKIQMLKNAGMELRKKLSQKTRTLLNRMARIDGAVLEYGILAYKDVSERGLRELRDEYKKMGWDWHQSKQDLMVPDRRDDFLEEWNRLSEVYQRDHRLRSLGDVVDNGLWRDMVVWISSHFPGYSEVKRVHKLRSLNHELLSGIVGGEYRVDAVEECKERYNAVIADEVTDFFMGKKDEPAPYVYLIDNYLRLSPKEKSGEPYKEALKNSPEVEETLLRILGCSQIALRSHVDWLGVPPFELLGTLRDLRHLNLSQDEYSSRNHSGYWSDLKKVLNGQKANGVFEQRAA